jgi:radical SAM superfamily enzyme YgiQ (UPF0313 family)
MRENIVYVAMKILLVIPPSPQKERWEKFRNVIQPYLPLGLAYIAATVKKEGHDVEVIDAPALSYSLENIRNKISNFSPDVVGQQMVFSNVDECYKVAALSKKIKPDVKVVLGGPHATLYPDKLIKNKDIDFVVCGEGEIVMRDLLVCLENGFDFSHVAGLVWKDGESVIKNSAQAFISDLDALPLPALHLFPVKKYRASSHLPGSRVFSMIASRGCPFRCAFCWSPRAFGKNYRRRKPDKVVEEMRVLKEQYRADSIRFWDDSFTANKKWVNTFCDLLIKSNLNIRWFCLTRVDLVDSALLKKMKDAGCCQIFYGIESGVQRILDLINKDITLDQAKIAVRVTKAAGIETTCSYMIGLPGETRDDTEQTMNFAIQLDSDYVQFNLVIPHMSGEEFCDLADNYGTVLKDVTSASFFNHPAYLPHGRTSEELKGSVKKAFRKFYLRPSYLLRRFYKMRGLPLRKYGILFSTGLKVLFWK